ncbi:SRPBCC family protein [Pseudonocardia aurantiaca]|uniref:SRPBCC family protein n=1 Tax=Pseudonocardia aurantiaca TaxID=75290 RepID=A0ABW4FEW4_9PSEU
MTTNVLRSIDVNVPVSTAYNQWTQFESFPQFMDGVERIEQLTPTRTHWVTRIAGIEREFDATVTEQHPDERVAWKTENGTHQAGVVTFHRLGDTTTRVTLQLDHEPEGFTETVGDALGIVEHQVKRDLEKFKEFIESRGREEGGWRGDVGRSPQTRTGQTRTGQTGTGQTGTETARKQPQTAGVQGPGGRIPPPEPV